MVLAYNDKLYAADITLTDGGYIPLYCISGELPQAASDDHQSRATTCLASSVYRLQADSTSQA